MQAVILTAGASTRFYPLNTDKPKPMVSLLGKPLLAWTIASLVSMDIKEIVLVVSAHSPVKEYFGDGKNVGAKITYVVQDKPLGMGNALIKAQRFVTEDFFLLHGHHLDVGGFIKPMVEKKRESDGVLLVEERENFWEYGVLEIEKGLARGLVEKPAKDKLGARPCVVGIYFLTPDFIPFLGNTPASHYQLENALDKWMRVHQIAVVKTSKSLSLKYPWDLLEIKDYLLEKLPHRISRGAKIGKGVILVGKMIIEDEVTIMENAVVKGPAFLGKNSFVGNNSLVREGSVLEENVRIGALSEVKNSILFAGTHLASGFLASSIIGENCRLAHGFLSANRRFDREAIKETGLGDFGVIMGPEVQTGIGVGTMPGITLGKGAVIGPGTFVFEDVEPGTEYKTEFKNLSKKRT